MEVDWDRYTSELKAGTMTDTELLQRVVHGAVLDVGCGLGSHLAVLETVTVRVGVDAGLAGLRRGKLMFPHLLLNCGSAYRLPYRSATFDSVVMIDVIEHLREPLAALTEIAKLLKPEGVLFIQTPNYPIKRLYDLSHYLRGIRKTLQDDPTHVSRLNCRDFISVVSQAGFEITRVAARNIMFDWYFRPLRQLRNTQLGQIFGQKVIIIAKKTAR